MEQKTIGIGMIGCGTVGTGVARLFKECADSYTSLVGARLELRKVLVRDKAKQQGNEDLVPPAILTTDADEFFATEGMDIVIEVAGGTGVVSDYVRKAIMTGRHVVTANKALLAKEGTELFALAHDHEVSIAFEASCGGGIPIITALQFGLMANRVDAMYGILNGTCNYILTEMTKAQKPYDVALKEAQEAGFAEADPTLDVSGKDAAQKLAILAELAFQVRVNEDQIDCEGIDNLDLFDIKAGGEMGYDIKLLAIAERRHKGKQVTGDTDDISLRVHPCFVPDDVPLAQVAGPFNALSVYGHALGHTMYYGRGAGQFPTASAIVSDVLNTASGWYPKAFAQIMPKLSELPVLKPADPAHLMMRYFVRVMAMDVPGIMAKICKIVGDHGISISGVTQHEDAAGQHVPVILTTHLAEFGAMQEALKEIEASDVIDGKPVCIRIIDLPEG